MRLSVLKLVFLLVVLLATVFVWIGDASRMNKSSSLTRMYWSTAKEDVELLVTVEDDESAGYTSVLGHKDELDGGFSSLDGMLQWAIGHSDPEKLKETAQDVQRLSAEELKKRQMEIKELMERLKMPSDAQLMQTAINDLNNLSLSSEDRQRALQELLILVEPIDNANDLHKLGGIVAVIRELRNPQVSIRITSAWILGKASQNNPTVQKQILDLGALAQLKEMVKSRYVEEATKALYAISSLIRNNVAGQELFYAEAGDLMLQDILSNSSMDIRLLRKAVFLVADLVESQLESQDPAELPIFSNHFFLKSVIDLTASTDLDLQEKALFAIKNLLKLRSTDALVFKNICGLDEALERMKHQLQKLMVEEDHREYAMDVESFRKEVELIFFRYLDKVDQAPPT